MVNDHFFLMRLMIYQMGSIIKNEVVLVKYLLTSQNFDCEKLCKYLTGTDDHFYQKRPKNDDLLGRINYKTLKMVLEEKQSMSRIKVPGQMIMCKETKGKEHEIHIITKFLP